MTSITDTDIYPHDEKLEQAIHDYLTRMNFDSGLKGFEYMKRAIEIVYMFHDTINGIVKKVYTPIAIEAGIKTPCVERNCRTLLRVRWIGQLSKGTANMPVFERPHNGKCVPSVKEFIYIACTEISKELALNAASKRNIPAP